jgi:hypothetical protein
MMIGFIIANSNAAVSWTILAGAVTLAISIGGFFWLKQADKHFPGLLTLAVPGALILAYGLWGKSSTTKFYYSIYFFVVPLAAAGIVFKGSQMPEGYRPPDKRTGAPQPTGAVGRNAGTLNQQYANVRESFRSDATRETLLVRFNELTRTNPTFAPTQWFFLSAGDLFVTDGNKILYASKNGIAEVLGAISVERDHRGEVSAFEVDGQRFFRPRPNARVQQFLAALPTRLVGNAIHEEN